MRIKNYLLKVFFLSITLLLLPGATMAFDIGGIPDSEISDHQQSWGYEDGPWKGPGPPLLGAADF